MSKKSKAQPRAWEITGRMFQDSLVVSEMAAKRSVELRNPMEGDTKAFPLYRAEELQIQVEAQLKVVAVEFFQWWWNQPGTNTAQGFDEWAAGEGAELIAEVCGER